MITDHTAQYPQSIRVVFDSRTGAKLKTREAPGRQEGIPLFPYLAKLASVVPLVGRASHWQTQTAGQDVARYHDPFYELHLIDKGEGIYEVNGKHIVVKTDDVLLLKPHDVHRYLPGSAFSYYSVFFRLGSQHTALSKSIATDSEDGFFRLLTDLHPETQGIHLSHSGHIRELLGKLIVHVRKPGIGSAALAGVLMVEVLIHVVRSLLFTKQKNPSLGENQTYRRDQLMVYQITEYINEHYAEDINPAALFEDYYLHPNYCRNIFKATTGMSVTAYLLHWRMLTARRFVEETDEKIATIAEMVGIADYSYFMRAFRKAFGMPPGELRKSMAKGH